MSIDRGDPGSPWLPAGGKGSDGAEATVGRAPVIALDGPGGAGKSTVARLVAERCGYTYIDTGAMYRAVALQALAVGMGSGAEPLDAGRVGAMAEGSRIEFRWQGGAQRVLLDGADVTLALRDAEVERLVPRVAALPEVRRALVPLQRRMAARGGVVMDGRDIGTCVLPDADFKFFVTADPQARAERRYRDLAARGERITRAAVERQLAERDRLDREREVGPLSRAPDAVVLDTTRLSVEETVARVLAVTGAGRSTHGEVPSHAPVG
jgi:cytidylate kinase